MALRLAFEFEGVSGQQDSWPHQEVVAGPSALETHWVLCDHVGRQESRMCNYLLEKVPWVFIQIYPEAFGLKYTHNAVSSVDSCGESELGPDFRHH